MSTIEDNPFKRSDDADFAQAPPPRSNRKWLVGCGIVGLLGMLICCGGVAYTIYVIPGAVAGAFEPEIAADPTIQEHIGEVESFKLDTSAFVENAQKASESGEDPMFAFRIEGTRGKGMVFVAQDPSRPGEVRIKSGKLVMEDGNEYPLEAGRTAGSDELEINMDEAIDDGQAVAPAEAPTGSPPVNLEVDTSLNP